MEYLQELRLEYEDYLRSQRGLSEKSVYDCWRFADRFLAFRFKGRRPDLSKIAAADIARFMQHLTSRGKPFRDKTPYEANRGAHAVGDRTNGQQLPGLSL